MPAFLVYGLTLPLLHQLWSLVSFGLNHCSGATHALVLVVRLLTVWGASEMLSVCGL